MSFLSKRLCACACAKIIRILLFYRSLLFKLNNVNSKKILFLVSLLSSKINCESSGTKILLYSNSAHSQFCINKLLKDNLTFFNANFGAITIYTVELLCTSILLTTSYKVKNNQISSYVRSEMFLISKVKNFSKFYYC